ncbi:DUF3533 domain-containing protein [Nocardioides sp. zg-536]|uniref:DUF3533 domain-containing protein n=1 Tax=Nocardioides faecalis TaxID=2803858 RepID=A0A939BVD6_9ACTN|nr:ABC transporter permease [Nocardioides faecalis]MBM9459462.1 DUF3533 domain-containing protein [Nocardioides faecalis]MBS4751703.1 DUF3533 domain-containing protein [Nocardioides faecalis]QVI59435.1 DUF3533 domain-containing protein [Nocardioides faecalis]
MSTTYQSDPDGERGAAGVGSSAREKYPPPPPETPAERKGRLIALFVMPFLIVTMMYATYVATMHEPTLQDLPVAVVGTGAAAEQFAEQLEDGADGALDVRVVADDATAKELIADQEVTGAILLPADGAPGGEATVYRASAGGASAAGTVQNLLGPAALAAGWTVADVDLAPLPDGDSSGTMVLFAAMGLMLAGYVPLSTILMAAPNLLRVRKFLPLALGWGALTSSLVWLILGPVVGAVDGHYPLFLGLGTLAVTAVGVAQMLFTKVLGPFAVLLGMLLWVIFGMPSSNLAMPVHSMPGFFGWLHDVLPLPAAGEALRAVIYFEAGAAWRHVGVLAAWLVGATLLAVLKERRSGLLVVGGPLYIDPDAPLPALSGGPVASYRKRLLAVAGFPLAIMLSVVTLMSFSMHEPTVVGMPVAVVGDAAQAQGFVDAMGPGLGDTTELEVLGSVEEAEERLDEQDLVAAYVLPVEQGGEARLLTAGGAGAAQQNAVTQMFRAVAAESGVGLQVRDVAPLTEDDTGGSNSMYVGMSWIMAGFLFLTVLRGGAPDLTRTRELLPLVAGWSVGISVWLWFLFDVLIGAVNGHALELIGYGALTVFAVGWVTGVFTRVFGLGALVPVMVVVMLAGVPASGGGLSIYMVPELFRAIGSWLPLPAAVDIARSIVYFDGTGIGRDLLVLAVWGVIGLLVNLLLVDRWVNRPSAKPHAPMGPRHVPDRGAKDEPAPEPELAV